MTTTHSTSSTLVISSRSTAVTAIERFAPANSAPSTTEEFTTAVHPPVAATSVLGRPEVNAAETRLREALSTTPGFVAGLLLAGQEGQIVLYSQWETVEAAPEKIGAPRRSRSPALRTRTSACSPSLPRTSRRWSSSLGSSLRGRSVPPGLLAVNFHHSLDGQRVLNLGLWSDFAGFAELETRPGFTPEVKYWEEYAGFRPHYFDVATVIVR